MTLALLFWILYIVGLVFFGFRNYSNRGVIFDNILWWVLFAIVGVGLFGNPIK